jgi:hypothetical protein
VTPASVIPNVEPFLPLITEGVLDFASDHGTPVEDAATLAGICLRESLAGAALKPPGIDGAGDWSVRTGHWTKRQGVEVFPDTDAARAELRALRFAIRKKNGQPVPGPYAIPKDRLGWGRGAFQLDVLGDQAHRIQPAPWPMDRQAYAACAQLALAREQLGAFAAHPLFGRAVLSRYNAALERVRAGIEAGDPDIGTTGGDYGRDVEELAEGVRARWPDRFPRRGA